MGVPFYYFCILNDKPQKIPVSKIHGTQETD